MSSASSVLSICPRNSIKLLGKRRLSAMRHCTHSELARGPCLRLRFKTLEEISILKGSRNVRNKELLVDTFASLRDDRAPLRHVMTSCKLQTKKLGRWVRIDSLAREEIEKRKSNSESQLHRDVMQQSKFQWSIYLLCRTWSIELAT